jgi:hypothetical protein
MRDADALSGVRPPSIDVIAYTDRSGAAAPAARQAPDGRQALVAGRDRGGSTRWQQTGPSSG